MNIASIDIRDILILQGLSSSEVFVGNKPTQIDSCVVVLDSGGDDPDYNEVYERPTIQVYVRSPKEDYVTGAQKAEQVKDALNKLTNTEVNNTRYVAIWLLGHILSLGPDDNGRHQFTVNFRIHRTNA